MKLKYYFVFFLCLCFTSIYFSCSSGSSGSSGFGIIKIKVADPFSISVNGDNKTFVKEKESFKLSETDFDISLIPKKEWIAVSFKNKTNMSAKLIWNESSITSPSENASLALNSGQRAIHDDLPTRPSIIPPGETLVDFILPKDHVSWEKDHWEIRKLIKSEGNLSVNLVLEFSGDKKREIYAVWKVNLEDSKIWGATKKLATDVNKTIQKEE